MSQPAVHWSSFWCKHQFLRCAAVLAAASVTGYLCVLPFALWQQGGQGAIEAALAALLCLAPALAALGVSCRFLGTPQALAAVLLGMMLRAFPPLVVCLLLAVRGSGADYIHFVSYLLVFYMITLAVETYLTVGLVKQKHSD